MIKYIIPGLLIIILWCIVWSSAYRTEPFSDVNPILKELLKHPEKTAKLLRSVLGDSADLGKYDLRDTNNAIKLKKKLYGGSKKSII